jgi:hypothetical protein
MVIELCVLTVRACIWTAGLPCLTRFMTDCIAWCIEVGPTESLILLQSFMILSQSASPTPPVADTAKGKERGRRERERERERDKTGGKVGRTGKEEATLSNETWAHYLPTSES